MRFAWDIRDWGSKFFMAVLRTIHDPHPWSTWMTPPSSASTTFRTAGSWWTSFFCSSGRTAGAEGPENSNRTRGRTPMSPERTSSTTSR